jgi:BlaI family penicillinase repressor
MAKSDLPPVTEAELKVLEALWRREAATIRELRDELYPGGGVSKFATVQKLLARLADKRLVGRRKQDGGWVFAARVARDAMIGGELRRVAERLGGDSMTPLLTFLVETGDLDADERAHLRRLLDAKPATRRKSRGT